ncbi:hypothetical protein V5799_009923 [Amblyomma americanum]|uniref:G-protein coupled receptors family 2 profile 2 domain-containing protein n=1 Tax=Amblyomma americanum TaxID=6943 RepID=A0AAQ4FAG3_AMBAM
MCACRTRHECLQRGDCCADRFLEPVRRPRIACVPAGFRHDLLAVALCPGWWTPTDEKDETKLRCEAEKRTNLTLTFLDDLPVLSRRSGVLYRNAYCASCNGDTRDLRNWQLNLMNCTPEKAFKALEERTATDVRYSYSLRAVTFRWGGGTGRARCYITIEELLEKDFAQKLNVTSCTPKRVVMTCPEEYADATVRTKCHSYTSMVEDKHQLLVYRNLHCAFCNGRNPESLRCDQEAQLGPPLRAGPPGAVSYAVVMDFSNWHASALSVEAPDNNCGREEIYEPFAKQCVPIGCPTDVCVRHDDCQWTRLGLNQVVVRDGATILPSSGSEELKPDRWHRDGPDAVMACMSTSPAALRPVGFEEVLSTALLLISVVCLVFHVMAYALLPKLRTGPSRLVLCLALSVLVAQGSFVAGGLFLSPGTAVCSVCAVVSHAAHLAAFFWMHVMAMDVQRTFRKGVSGSSRAGSAFAAYSAYAWFAPALLIAASSTLQYVMPDSPWSPSYGWPYCWINRPLSLIAFFGAPVLLLLLSNIVLFLLTARSIHQTTQQTKVARRSVPNGGNSEQSRLTLYVKLAVVFGLTWVFGFAAALSGVRGLWYPFIVLCSLQGAFIFFAFTFKRSVFRMVRDRLCGTRADRRQRPRSTSTTLTTALHSTLSASSTTLASVATGRVMPPHNASPKGVQKPLLRRT